MKVLLLPFKLLFLSRGSQSRTDWLYHSCGTVPCKPQWPAEAGNQEVSREQQLLWLLRQTKCASSAGGSWRSGARRSECASSPGRSSGARQSECASLSWEILAVWGKAEWVCWGRFMVRLCLSLSFQFHCRFLLICLMHRSHLARRFFFFFISHRGKFSLLSCRFSVH